MSIKQFSKYLNVSVLEDDADVMKLAILNVNESAELQYIKAMVYIQGTMTNERLKLKIHSSANTNLLIAESNEVRLSNAGQNFFGLIRFDFPKTPIHSGFDYHLNAYSENYTRIADTHYISFVHDWPNRSYSSVNVIHINNPMTFPMAVEIFGRKA